MGSRRLRHALLSVALSLALSENAGFIEVEDQERLLPPFFDYDCDLVNTIPGAAVDWNAVFKRIMSDLNSTDTSEWRFEMPPELRYLVTDGQDQEEASSASGRRPTAATSSASRAECPLGYLYLQILNFYELQVQGSHKDELLAVGQEVYELMGMFPTYALALNRWPIFYALEFFSDRYPEDPESLCTGVNGIIDWDEGRAWARRWAVLKRGVRPGKMMSEEDAEELENLELQIAAQFFDILRKPERQEQAYDECEFGFHFLVSNQVLNAANRQTQHMPPFNKIVDRAVGGMPWYRVGSSGWPIWQVLAIFADLNKGLWFFGGDRKYLRGYSDWNLRRDELSILTPPNLDFLSEEWKAAVAPSVDSLLGLSHEEYAATLHRRVAQREATWGAVRPIARSLLDAALAVAAATSPASRRLAYVVLLYGGGWAKLLGRLVGRLKQLDVRQPLLVIAIGPEAASACRALALGVAKAREGGERPHDVVCWTPETSSQVHRFTGIHAMLHLGVDVIYMDMDTFLLRDPTQRILASADGWDALFARHADADCINIGIFFLRSSSRTAVWMSQFLAWYHDHPFEIDQRGLHVFLRIPSKQMQIAYPPEDLVQLRGGVLEDVNEVVIGDVKWAGILPRMLIFHWCHRPLALKEQEINAAYDAADVLQPHGLPLSLALSLAHAAAPDSAWHKVLNFRVILESYQSATPPERTACW